MRAAWATDLAQHTTDPISDSTDQAPDTTTPPSTLTDPMMDTTDATHKTRRPITRLHRRQNEIVGKTRDGQNSCTNPNLATTAVI